MAKVFSAATRRAINLSLGRYPFSSIVAGRGCSRAKRTKCIYNYDKVSSLAPSLKNDVMLRDLLITLLVIVVALLVWSTLHIFLLIFLSVILAIFLRKSGEWIVAKSRVNLSAGWGISVILLLILGFASLAIWVVAPRLVEQIQQLSNQLPGSWQHIEQIVSQTAFGNWLMQQLPAGKGILEGLSGLMHKATSWLYSAAGALAGILIIFFLGLYLAYGAGIYIEGIVKLVPPKHRGRAIRTLRGLGATLFWWLIGRLMSMAIIGSFTMLGLWLLGVPLAFVLGLFAAVMTFIPNIGPIISVLPAALMALQQGWMQAGYVVALYTVVQTIESYMITPLIQRQAIAMPPALILSAQIIMGVLQGVLGVLVATPLVATVMVVVKLLYIEDVLGDHDIEIRAETHGRHAGKGK